jgi:hypothetical protein
MAQPHAPRAWLPHELPMMRGSPSRLLHTPARLPCCTSHVDLAQAPGGGWRGADTGFRIAQGCCGAEVTFCAGIHFLCAARAFALRRGDLIS